MADLTLSKMRLGGIWDHIGYGFHRYSTDREWLLPHFEKMLYDQAMLLFAYTEGWNATDNPLFRQTIYKIVEYLDDCLTSPEGAFYSAEDADSEGEEGKFYVWKYEEILEFLSAEESEQFFKIYQITENGNFRDESTGQKTRTNIPHLESDLFEIAKKTDIEPEKLKNEIDQIHSKLKKIREVRIRPLLDDKILTDWNGLMIASLAKAGSLLSEEKFISMAEKAWETIHQHCVMKDHTLLHRLKDGEAAIEGMADDYAFLIFGLIELYQATFKPIYLETALNIQERFDDLFYDKEFGGYYFTSRSAHPLLGRQKEIYDGALPSSNSVAASNCFRLFSLTAKSEHNDRFQQLFKAFSDPISDAPSGYTAALQAWSQHQNGASQIIITIPELNSEVKSIISNLRKIATPGSTFLLKTNKTQMNKSSELLKNYAINDQLTIYVCSQFKCKTPVHTYEKALDMLTH